MTRLRAFFYHLLLSAVIVGTVLSIVMFFWYPHPYFKVSGAMDPIRVLITVDLIMGPLLTLVLFRPGKWGLKFDMTCVFTLQIAALIYGTYTLYAERPYYTVFVQDRFEVLARKDVVDSEIKDEAFRTKPWTQPIYAIATLPEDLMQRQRIMEEVLFEGKPDINQRPELWSRFDDKNVRVNRAMRPLSDLLERRPDQAELITEAMQDYAEIEALVYVPITSRLRALALLIDRDTLRPVGALNIDPWKKPTAKAAGPAKADNSG